MGSAEPDKPNSANYDVVRGVMLALKRPIRWILHLEDNPPASVNMDLEANCWGCGLPVLVSPHAPVSKCTWCGALTKQKAVKIDNKCFRLRRFRDWCFVCIVILFMLFFICGGIWAVFPIVFSISYFCGVFNFVVAVILSISTLSSFCLAAFRPAGAPPMIVWGSTQTVGKGGLENYTFCHFCSKPKSPRVHHCRSCGMCILDMDHHCPFIGNCVGAANHRAFILFLISTVISTLYLAFMTFHAALYIWPPMSRRRHLRRLSGFVNAELIFRVLKEDAFAFLRSALFLPVRGRILVYLFVASVSVGVGLSVLLWQQLSYIYTGQTYLSHLSEVGNEQIVERDCQNLVKFFGCRFSAAVFSLSYWKSRKSHKH